MNEAPTGLRLAAPKISGKSVADLSAEDLLAGMSAETRTAMAAALAAEAPPPAKAAAEPETDPEDGEGGEPGDDKKDGMKEPAANAEAFAAGQAAERERTAAVFASEHFAGREQQAAKMLANPKLTAEEINGLLADMPDAGGAQMLDALRGQNANLGAGGGDDLNPQASTDNIWKKAHAQNNDLRRRHSARK